MYNLKGEFEPDDEDCTCTYTTYESFLVNWLRTTDPSCVVHKYLLEE